MTLNELNASPARQATGESFWLESELCHRQMLRAIPVAVYTCDTQGLITFYNLAAAKLWGHSPELNKDLWYGSWKIFRSDGSPMTLDECPMARTVREGKAIHGEEIVVERMNGSRSRVLAHLQPIFSSTGQVVGAVNTLVELNHSSSTGLSAPL